MASEAATISARLNDWFLKGRLFSGPSPQQTPPLPPAPSPLEVALLDASDELAAISTDPSGHITLFSEGASRLLQYSTDQMRGQCPTLLFERESDDPQLPGLDPVATLERRADLGRQLGTLLRADGSSLPAELEVRRLESRLGDRIGYLILARAIDAPIEAPAKPEEPQQTELEFAHAEIARLQAALALHSAQAEVGALVPGVAHELNTPLGNAVTTASLLQDRTRELGRAMDDGTLRRTALASYVQDVHTGVDILQRSLQSAFELVAHFKQMSVDQVSIRRREFKLADVVADVLAVLSSKLDRARCRVETDIHLRRELDSFPGPLSQVLSNLVQNALIHGFAQQPGGVIRIAAREFDSERFELVIEDNGAGMTPEVRKRAFEPYFTTRANSGGSGLGLHIARDIVASSLDGKLRLETAPGKGCRFTLWLPYVSLRISPQINPQINPQ